MHKSQRFLGRLSLIVFIFIASIHTHTALAAFPVVSLPADTVIDPAGVTSYDPVCTASDPDEDPLTITWATLQGNNGKFVPALNDTTPTLLFKTFSGAYHINCTADDGTTGVGDEQIISSSTISTRLSGANRYDTAVAISQNRFFDEETNAVVIASGENFPDALTAGPLAATVNSPILLVKHNEAPAAVIAEIERIWDHNNADGTDIYVIGGTAAINDSVITDILAGVIGSPNVERIAGANRYATAIAIADKMNTTYGYSDLIAVASGLDFADAAAIASPASNWWVNPLRMPILLNDGGALRPENAAYLETVNDSVTTVHIAGGTSAISDAAATTLGSYGTVHRHAGANRFETAAAIAEYFYPAIGFPSVINVGVTSGLNFPDALTGGLFAGYANMPILYVDSAIPTETATYLSSISASLLNDFVFGGTASVSNTVESSIVNTINCSGC